jgi:hypothetical protein
MFFLPHLVALQQNEAQKDNTSECYADRYAVLQPGDVHRGTSAGTGVNGDDRKVNEQRKGQKCASFELFHVVYN